MFRRREDGLHIAYISSALCPESAEDKDSFDFFALLLEGVVRNASERDHIVSVYVPKKETGCSSDQAKVLKRVLSHESAFDAFIIAPFKTDEVITQLNDFFEERKKYHSDTRKVKPIIFIDKCIGPEMFKGGKVPSEFVVVNFQCKNLEGGAKAARILEHDFAHRAIDRLSMRFMVLCGLEGGEQRVEGFKKELSKHGYPESAILCPESDDLNFTRAGAEKWMAEQIRNLGTSVPEGGQASAFGQLADIGAWGIFACNDEMALGVRTVVAREYRRIRERLAEATQLGNQKLAYSGNIATDFRLLLFLQDLRIVGFDGISDALELIPSRGDLTSRHRPEDTWLVGTICANAKRQTEFAIEWLQDFIDQPNIALKSTEIRRVDVIGVSPYGEL